MNKKPCKGCVPPKRTPHCHEKCPDYEEYLADLEQIKKERAKDSMVNRYIASRSRYIRKWEWE